MRIADEALEEAVRLAEERGEAGRLPDSAAEWIDLAAAHVCCKHLVPPRDPAGLAAEIERLASEKEAAIADQDFEKAARIRNQADRLKEQRERTERSFPVVGAAAVREAAALFGDDAPRARATRRTSSRPGGERVATPRRLSAPARRTRSRRG